MRNFIYDIIFCVRMKRGTWHGYDAILEEVEGFISYGIGLSSIWFDSIRFDSFQFISRHIEFLYTFRILHVYKSP